MEQHSASPAEASIRASVERGDINGAAVEAIRSYGPEIFGLLLALHRGDAVAADEVFSAFCERLWQGLGRFQWSCSLRTWAYTVARNASIDHTTASQRRARRAVPLSGCPAVAEAAVEARTMTPSYLRTESRSAIARLREELPDEDQALLILRIDRDMPWSELARIFLEDEAASAEALQRESARLRKRFQTVKRRLVELGRRRGLLPEREV